MVVPLAAKCGGSSKCEPGLDAASSAELVAEKVALLLLMRRRSEWPASAWADTAGAEAWGALMDVSTMTIVEAEVRADGGRGGNL